MKCADMWIKSMAHKLKKDVKQEQKKNFLEFLKQGGRLSYKELQDLDADWKEDYVKRDLLDDVKVQGYLKGQIENYRDENFTFFEAGEDIQDTLKALPN